MSGQRVLRRMGVNSFVLSPDVIARLTTMSNEPTPGTPAQASSFIAAEVARWAEVVKKGNIQVQ